MLLYDGYSVVCSFKVVQWTKTATKEARVRTIAVMEALPIIAPLHKSPLQAHVSILVPENQWVFEMSIGNKLIGTEEHWMYNMPVNG